ncbi:hypothetical protein OSTOST_13351, partial [Ostertagia ostertagi]
MSYAKLDWFRIVAVRRIFQVPDHLAAFPGSHVIHRPSWSIRGVDTAADHLCILWCNQLTRHSTRILYRYGLEEIKTNPRSARTVVKEFFDEEHRKFLQNSTEITSELERYGEAVMGSSSSFVKSWSLRLPMGLTRLSRCFRDASLLFIHTNSLARSAILRGDSKVMTINLPYNSNSTSGHIVMEGKSACEYDITIKPNVFHAWYLLLVSNARLLMHFTFSILIALAVIEKLAGNGQVEHCGRNGFYLNGAILIAVFLCFTYNSWLLESVFITSIFYAISCLYYVAIIVKALKELVYRAGPKFAHFLSMVMNLLMLLLLPFNVYLANSALALFMIWKRSSGPFAIILGVAAGSVSAALGLSGPSRSRSEHLVGHILEADLLNFTAIFYFLLNSIDFSNS